MLTAFLSNSLSNIQFSNTPNRLSTISPMFRRLAPYYSPRLSHCIYNLSRTTEQPVLGHSAFSMATRARHPGFQPLSPSHPSENSLQLRGIVFDMDGTLYTKKGEPQNYMFAQMRAALGITKPTDILDHMHSLPEPEQTEAFRKVQDIEREAMRNQIPQPGLAALMEFLDQCKIPKGICTRNFDAPVKHLLEKHIPGHVMPFTPVVTRDFKPPKPSPAGILHIARAWGVVGDGGVLERLGSDQFLPLVMVGDSVDDMAAGRDAGALTVLLRSVGKGQSEDLANDERTDVVIDKLDELIALLESGLSVSKR